MHWPCPACGRPQRAFIETAIRDPNFPYRGEPAAFANATRYGSDESEFLPIFRSDLMSVLMKIGGWTAQPLLMPDHPEARKVIETLTEIRKVAV